MITARQVWTEVFRLDRDNREVRVEPGENGLTSLVIANPEDHFYVEVSLDTRSAQALAAELQRVSRPGGV
jgi:hypothetical protein